MTDALARIIHRFRTADRQTRLELLLDYSKRLPPLPAHLIAARDQGLNRVHECQSPVYLYLVPENGGVRLYADAPREAPTVRGFVSVLERAIQGAPAAEAAALPPDLLEQLGLAEALGMTRMQGLTAIVGQIRRMAAELARS